MPQLCRAQRTVAWAPETDADQPMVTAPVLTDVTAGNAVVTLPETRQLGVDAQPVPPVEKLTALLVTLDPAVATKRLSFPLTVAVPLPAVGCG